MKSVIRCCMFPLFLVLAVTSCADQKKKIELSSIDLIRGEITLCSSGTDDFGQVTFPTACSKQTDADFNLAIALLHSFEYTEAEKVFAKIIDRDPHCVLAYWGVAMCNFHPLWAPPSKTDLEKGEKIVALGRSVVADTSSRESYYLEAIAPIYDNFHVVDYRTRLARYAEGCRRLFTRYPDTEAAIFYALALGATADPADKAFSKQKKAGDILNEIFEKNPDHPGVAHYLIHNYDYPELAQLGLPAARKYASVAPASAHAQHMPSHIFTRLGLWDEAIQSNLNSISSAQCYAEQSGKKAHWDEELHGMDYLTYAYLQQAQDDKAMGQFEYSKTIKEVFPVNFKCAYSFAAIPSRFALERKDWLAAAAMKLEPEDFPWKDFPWERSNVNFARLLGAAHIDKMQNARKELEELKSNYAILLKGDETYKATLVLIQIKAGESWIRLKEGREKDAIALMTEAANMEDRTSKHPVTPGEILPARELLGDMLLSLHNYGEALTAYEQDLDRHPGRFNGLFGAGFASEQLGDNGKASRYYRELLRLAGSAVNRPELLAAREFLTTHTPAP